MTDYRVIETGLTHAGQSTIEKDRVVPVQLTPGGWGLGRLWEADGVLFDADAASSDDAAVSPAADDGPPFPTAGGVRFWTITVRPENGAEPQELHQTPTIDVGLVLSGRVVLDMEDGTSAELSAGDAFAQQSTSHRWRNPHTEDAVIAVVMMGRGH
jgi:hypothetical protein